MPLLKYRVVDVFTTQALEGNALAVFTDAAQIEESMLQKIAREMNLAETAFLFPPDNPACAARVRIFTPQKEMDFAGHPTIGTSFVLLDEGIVPPKCESFCLEEKVGLIPISVEAGERPMIWLRTPSIRKGKFYDRSVCAHVLGLDDEDLLSVEPQILDAGNPTLFIALKDEVTVDRAWLDLEGMRTLKNGEGYSFCVFVFCVTRQGAYSRMFAPTYGVPEDPATGSSAGPLAAFMMLRGLLTTRQGSMRLISEQGTKMGRRSFLHVKIAGPQGEDGIYVGGHVTPIAEGVMKL
jgi:trans-2,3-dihydro-3-hydroxyanthranilate isomerase